MVRNWCQGCARRQNTVIFKKYSLKFGAKLKVKNMPLNWAYTKIFAPSGAMASNLWSMSSRRPADPACRRKCRWKLSSNFPTIRPTFSRSSTLKSRLQKTMKCSSRSARCQWITEIWSHAISTIFFLKISTCISSVGSWRESHLDWMPQEIACLAVNLLVNSHQ